MLALIPARGGSKSVPLKNLHPLGGRPLLARVLGAALDAELIDRVAVTTDHEGIANYARGLAEIVQRPAYLSNGDVPMWIVASHACAELDYTGPVVFLQPTYPFVKPETIDKVCQGMKTYACSEAVCEVPHHFHAWNQRSVDMGVIEWATKAREGAQQKEKKPRRVASGGVFAFQIEQARRQQTCFPDHRGVACVVPWWEAYDVDGPEDFKVAEKLVEFQ